MEGLADAVGSCGNSSHAYTSRVMDRIENCWRGRNYGLFANSFRPKRSQGRWILDQNRFNWRHITHRWNQVVVQILAFARKEFFHERHAETLRHATFDLP